MKLQVYTLRYLVIALLVVVAVWAGLFYAVILEEVYDNIDDGLKNSKLQIIREAHSNENVLNTPDYGINQFKITPLPKGDYDDDNKLISTFEFSEYDNEDQPIRILECVFEDANGNPHLLSIKASMVEEDELLEDLLTALIALYVMLVISVAVINHLILRKVWKSFYQLLEKLKSFKLGTDTYFKSPHSPIEEFKILGRELEDMLKRNEAIYSSQKQFIENASHELQTPLAISLNKLELFADNNTLPDEQMMELGKISDTLNRLVRLNKSLLMLSKIENRQYAEEDVINFNELLEQLVLDYEDLADYKTITINIESRAPLLFKMNKGLALTLVSNLLKNAILHNHIEGIVTIIIDDTSVTINNTGSNKALETGSIFKRFYRDSNNEQSTGLGLSIVNSIITNYGITIVYSFHDMHSFKIVFPKRHQ